MTPGTPQKSAGNATFRSISGDACYVLLKQHKGNVWVKFCSLMYSFDTWTSFPCYNKMMKIHCSHLSDVKNKIKPIWLTLELRFWKLTTNAWCTNRYSTEFYSSQLRLIKTGAAEGRAGSRWSIFSPCYKLLFNTQSMLPINMYWNCSSVDWNEQWSEACLG